MSSLDEIRRRAAAAGGRVAVVILDPSGGEALAIAPDEAMPAASAIKLPLVMTLFHDAAAGRVDVDERVPVGVRAGGSGVLRDLASVEELSLRDLAALAISVSDNTATNRLIERVGIERVNERLDEWGCPTTRLRRAMFDLEARARGVTNIMTARETAALLRRVWIGAAAGDAASVSVLALLERNTDRTRLGRYLPPRVALAHKDGWDEDPGIDNDAGIVWPGAARGGSPERGSHAAVAVGFTTRVETGIARQVLGTIGHAAAEIAGAQVGPLPFEVSRTP